MERGSIPVPCYIYGSWGGAGTSRESVSVHTKKKNIIGNNDPVHLLTFIETLENALGKKAEKNMLPLQAGDVPATYANVDDLVKDMGYKPETKLETGIQNFVNWYKEFYKVA